MEVHRHGRANHFYEREIAPVLKSGRKIAVIISDALRYEVAQELSERIDRKAVSVRN